LFWKDRWLQGKCLAELAPCLFAAVRPCAKRVKTVALALSGDSWILDITGALTVQVILDYLLVWDLTRDIQLTQGVDDHFCWKWTSDGIFTTSSAYHSFFIGQHPIDGAGLLRKMCAPPKCKFFIWLVLHDRCWTAARRKKHGLQDNDDCALCSQVSETIDHILIECSFSRELWFNFLHRVGWGSIPPSTNSLGFVAWSKAARKRVQKDDRRCFDSVVILISWILWKERNCRTFDRSSKSVSQLLSLVLDEMVAWFWAGHHRLEPLLLLIGRLPGRALPTV
jgi:hypothetical protein